MAKRFTDTEKWKKPFVKGMQTVYKLFWLYILDNCNHAGIWQVEKEVAEIRMGEKIDLGDALKQFGDHVVILDNGSKWFIPDFIEFQYGELKSDSKVHNSVISVLQKYKIKLYTNSLQTVKDKDIDKDEDKDKDIFDEIRKFYPGTKRGLNTEFSNFKRHKDWKLCLSLLKPAIEQQIKWRELAKTGEDSFIPPWKNFKTWINNRCWEDEMPTIKKKPDPYDFIKGQGKKFNAQFLGEENQPE